MLSRVTGAKDNRSEYQFLRSQCLEYHPKHSEVYFKVIYFFRGSSQPRDQNQASCIADGLHHLSHQGSQKVDWCLLHYLFSFCFLVHESDSVSRSVMSLLFVTPGTVAYQAPLSMGFSRQQHWSGLPFPARVNDHIFPLEPHSYGYNRYVRVSSSSQGFCQK